MKTLYIAGGILVIVGLLLGSCAAGFHLGWSSFDNEVVGQVKRVQYRTPILCLNYTETDISLGVLRNGVGSISTEDKWFWVPNPSDAELLKQAQDVGALVRVSYNAARFRWCVEEDMITKVELVR